MIFVAIPVAGGIAPQTVASLLQEQAIAIRNGVDFHVAILPDAGGCIPVARNHLVRDFLASTAERLCFVDADVGWQPGQLLKLACCPHDFVGGAYRYTTDEREHYPVEWLDKPNIEADPETGLIEVASLPGGFLSLSRNVFERLKEAFPDRGYTDRRTGEAFHGYFYSPVGSSEDGAFCWDWRRIGGKIWLDPSIPMTHTGGKTFAGHIGNWLRSLPRTQAEPEAA